jgi:predicted ATPase
LANLRFLEIGPGAARKPSDRFEEKVLRSDASNLPAVLAHLREKTASKERPNGVLSDIAADLASLIPSIRELQVESDPTQKQYSFALKFSGDMTFSSRVISDGTLRLLALLTVLNDPDRRGTLCFEEPENGVHEGRVPILVEFLRQAAQIPAEAEFASFQILINTHSPKVMSALREDEIVVADSVSSVDPKMGSVSTRTRMRTGITPEGDLFDPEFNLSRFEIDKLLQGANASLSRSEPPTTGAAITYSAAPPHRKRSRYARR